MPGRVKKEGVRSYSPGVAEHTLRRNETAPLYVSRDPLVYRLCVE
jgi:hypothetical protein